MNSLQLNAISTKKCFSRSFSFSANNTAAQFYFRFLRKCEYLWNFYLKRISITFFDCYLCGLWMDWKFQKIVSYRNVVRSHLMTVEKQNFKYSPKKQVKLNRLSSIRLHFYPIKISYFYWFWYMSHWAIEHPSLPHTSIANCTYLLYISFIAMIFYWGKKEYVLSN